MTIKKLAGIQYEVVPDIVGNNCITFVRIGAETHDRCPFIWHKDGTINIYGRPINFWLWYWLYRPYKKSCSYTIFSNYWKK